MRRRWYVAGGLLAVLVIGACSHEDGGSDKAAGGLAAAPAAPVPGKAALDDVGRVSGGGGSSPARRPAGSQALPLVDGSYKIQVARMTVAVKGARNVAAKANEATAIAEQAGGEVDRDDRTSGAHASASMLLRVPPDALTDTLARLAGLGTEKFRSLSTTDVTQKVADVSSRVNSARESIARLRVLFQHATKIGAIIEIESELNSREADLESLEAQQRALARQTSLASINLNLVTAQKKAAPPKPPKQDHDNSFVAGLKNGWDGFTGAAAWVAGALGTLLPFLVLLLALGAALKLAWPRVRPGRRTSPAPSGGAST